VPILSANNAPLNTLASVPRLPVRCAALFARSLNIKYRPYDQQEMMIVAGHWAAGALRIIAVGGRRRPGISVSSSSSALGCWLATGRMGAIGLAKLPRPPVLIRGFFCQCGRRLYDEESRGESVPRSVFFLNSVLTLLEVAYYSLRRQESVAVSFHATSLIEFVEKYV
jgi:hypothetical protein